MPDLTKQGYDMIIDRVINMKITPPDGLTIAELKRWMEGHADAQAEVVAMVEQMKDSNGR